MLERAPVYESIAALILDQPRQVAESGSEGVVIKLIRLREKYVTIARTSTFVAAVAKRLNMPREKIQASLVAVAPGFSLVILVGGRTGDRSDSREIAAAVADELIRYIAAEQQTDKIPAEDRFELSLASPAEAGRKVSPRGQDAARWGGAIAALVLLAAYLFVQAISGRRQPPA